MPSRADQEEVDPAAKPKPPAAQGKGSQPLGENQRGGGIGRRRGTSVAFPMASKARWQEGATKATAAVERTRIKEDAVGKVVVRAGLPGQRAHSPHMPRALAARLRAPRASGLTLQGEPGTPESGRDGLRCEFDFLTSPKNWDNIHSFFFF